MTHRKWGIFALTLVMLLTGFAVNTQTGVLAQTPIPNSNPNVVISFPPPVYVLRGEVEVRGTVNLPNLANYFLEFRPLDSETMLPFSEEAPWLPASLPETGTILDDVLATWDTLTVEDGLYELRLTANVSRQGPVHFRVSPLRVENVLPPFLTPDQVFQPTPTTGVIISQPTPTSGGIVIVRPTLAATPTSISNDPIVTANLDSNVRSGDSTSYPVVGSLPSGFTAPVLGISNTGSGWYYIELNNGRRGFISPTVVQVSGNLANVQRIAPPPPLLPQRRRRFRPPVMLSRTASACPRRNRAATKPSKYRSISPMPAACSSGRVVRYRSAHSMLPPVISRLPASGHSPRWSRVRIMSSSSR